MGRLDNPERHLVETSNAGRWPRLRRDGVEGEPGLRLRLDEGTFVRR